MNTPALIETCGLRLDAGARCLVRSLTLQIHAGELWVLIGPNGSGKTSLLHALAGLRAPDAGQVLMNQRALDDWPLELAARLRGLLPQNLHDAFAASALDIALMGRHPHLSGHAWEGEADRQAARDALAAVDMLALAERNVLSLSGGERARVGIATLLAQDADLMLLDEPLAHLDLHHQIVVLDHLRMLAQQRAKAVMLALHDLNLARRYASHALLLPGDGQALAGPVAAVMTAPHLSAAFGHAVLPGRVAGHDVFVAG